MEEEQSLPIVNAEQVMLMRHFEEETDQLFPLREEDFDCRRDDVLVQLPRHPVLVFCGRSHLQPTKMVLRIEGKSVQTGGSFFENLALLMACYYAFNMAYPSTASATLDILQRIFLCINPEKGTKSTSTKKKKITSIHPEVLDLLEAMTNFTWTT